MIILKDRDRDYDHGRWKIQTTGTFTGTNDKLEFCMVGANDRLKCLYAMTSDRKKFCIGLDK